MRQAIGTFSHSLYQIGQRILTGRDSTDRRRRRIESCPKEGVWILSYPKTGRTWLRMLLGKYLCLCYSLDDSQVLETKTLTSLAGVEPTRFSHDGSDLSLLKSFRNIEPSRGQYRSRKVLLLRRSIEDSMVSAYFQATKRTRIFEGSISEFLRDERFGVEKFTRFYQAWFEQKDRVRKFATVSYEGMHADTASVLRSVLECIGNITVDEQTIQESVKYCSFINMRAVEQSRKLLKFAMRSPAPGDPDSSKVRRGVVGGYVDYLSAEDLEFIRQVVLAAECPFVTLASSGEDTLSRAVHSDGNSL